MNRGKKYLISKLVGPAGNRLRKQNAVASFLYFSPFDL
jgi:hypothetical protein